MPRLTVLAAVLVLSLAAASATRAAVFEPRHFSSSAQQERYVSLLGELRCLVCQNESILSSNADLAADLRRIVYEMMRGGHTNEEIIHYLVQRYGDFVLYNPPFKPETVLLWTGPFLMLAAGLVILFREVRRRRAQVADDLDDEDRDRISQALGDDAGESPGRGASA